MGGPAIAEVLGGRSILEGPTFLWGDLEPLCTPCIGFTSARFGAEQDRTGSNKAWCVSVCVCECVCVSVRTVRACVYVYVCMFEYVCVALVCVWV